MCEQDPAAIEASVRVDIKARVLRAMNRLLEQDAYLLHHAVSEQSVTHRLALYLECEFPGSDVDCEYDKNIDHATGRKNIAGVGDARPDIIVHRRGANYPTNLLAIEAKKHDSREPRDRDWWKLRGLLDPAGDYRFQVVAFLLLWVGEPLGATLVFGDDDPRYFGIKRDTTPWPWFGTACAPLPSPKRRGRPRVRR
jgi:hypothetical protein